MTRCGAWIAPRKVTISNDEVAELVAFMKSHGKRKVLFGTNYPMITAQKALEGLEKLGLDDAAKALFLGGNAQRVFNLQG